MAGNGTWKATNREYELDYIRFSLKGSGENLVIHAGEATEDPGTFYNITYNTGNLNITNKLTQVKANAEYTTQILDTAKYSLNGKPIITMNNIIITDDVWNAETRTVTINNVTGNVVITANEKEVELTYTDLVTTNYTTGRLSSSNGTVDSGSTSFVSTDFIPWVPNSSGLTTLRVGSVNNTISFINTGNCRVIFYDNQ
jgi:hypothetical protein